MKKSIRKFISAVLLLLILLSGISVNSKALNNMTGEEWNNLDKDAKEIYLKGWIDGMNIAIVGMYSELQEDIDLDLLAEQLRREGTLLEFDTLDYINSISNFNSKFKNKPKKTVFDIMVEENLDF